jgi:gliding motility-associated-like protein
LKTYSFLPFLLILFCFAFFCGGAVVKAQAPKPPVLDPVTVLCEAGNPTVASLKARYDNQVRVYSTPTSSTPLPDNTILVHERTYYLSAFDANNGESTNRSQTEIFISTPKLVIDKNNICGGNVVKITAKGVPQSRRDFEADNADFERFLEYKGVSYYVKRQSMGWTEAYNLIQSLGAGASMYVIDDKDEEDVVFEALSQLGLTGTHEIHFWLGLRQIPSLNPNNRVDEGWQWIDGRMLTSELANWSSGEPNDTAGATPHIGDGEEDFAQLDYLTLKTWNDMQNVNASGNSWPIFELNPTTNANWGYIDPKTGADIALPDLDTNVITVTPTESTTYFYEFASGNKTCRAEVDIRVLYTPDLLPADDLELCDSGTDANPFNGRVMGFDLKEQEDNILDGTADTGVYFFSSSVNAQALVNAIDASVLYTNISNPQTIYYRTYSTLTGCPSYQTGSFKLNVLSPPDINIVPHYECDDLVSGSDTDLIKTFDLTLNNDRILNLLGGAPNQYLISYHESIAEGADLTQPGITSYTTTASDFGRKRIFVRVIDILDPRRCYSSTNHFDLVVGKLPVLVNETVVHEECDETNDDDSDNTIITNLTYFNELFSANHRQEVFQYFKLPNYDPASEIKTPAFYTNIDGFGNLIPSPDVIYVRVNNPIQETVYAPNGNCFRNGTLELKVVNNQINPSFNLDFYACETLPAESQDGIITFPQSIFTELSAALVKEHPAFLAPNVVIKYYATLEDAAEKKNQIDTSVDYTNRNPIKSSVGWTDAIWASVETIGLGSGNITCVGLKQVASLNIERLPIAHAVKDIRVCDANNDGIASFDTSTINRQLLMGQQNIKISFYDASTNTLLYNDALPDPFNTTSISIIARLTNDKPATSPPCGNEVRFSLIVDDKPVFNALQTQFSCDGSDGIIDGLAAFDTRGFDAAILQGQQNVSIAYSDAKGVPLPSPLPDFYLTKTTTINVNLTNTLNGDCYSSGTLDLVVQENPLFDLEETLFLCSTVGVLTIEARNPKANYSYSWEHTNEAGVKNTLPITAPQLLATETGTYTVTATDPTKAFCETTKSVVVKASSKTSLTKDNITVTDVMFGQQNSITIDTSNIGGGSYEFSLNGGAYQDSNVFNNVKAGIHTISIRDKNGCGIVNLTVSVLGYIKYFSPNGDGINETWKIRGADSAFYASATIHIFDRFGRLIKTLTNKDDEWNGTFKGTPMPNDDYWFHVSLKDGRSFSGHFSLIR